MKVITGDLIKLTLEGHFDVIIHGCNCFRTMGAGIAKQIKQTFPEAYIADCNNPCPCLERLGNISYAVVKRLGRDFVVVNAYTQLNYSRVPGKVSVDYNAVRRSLRRVKSLFSGQKIGYPMIGCGLAGGDWDIISQIIDEELAGEDHTLIILQ